MADFESVQSIRGAKLSDQSVHVQDVLAISLVEEDEYQVGTMSMAAYDFVPYALTGLSAAMVTPATGARASTHVTVPIEDDKGGSDAAGTDVTIYGPGDVLGVDGGQIVRRYPAPGSTNAEETFHAHIELDRTEIPWAFSAQTPGDTMRAWLALVALERDEVEWEPMQAGLQPIMSVDAALLPPLDTSWAWAHAQTLRGTSALSARLSTAYAPVNVSRLLAARVLTQNTNYVACLVPTTDAGRRAGLGQPEGTLGPAWTSQDGTVRLPVYDRWEFRTAPDGDFARLARRLVGVAAPWRIGRRTMDASRPGDPLTDLAEAEAGRRQVIKCALFSPAAKPPDEPSDTAGWTDDRTADLKEALERPGVIEGTAGTAPGDIPDLPIVGPRIYAKSHRATSTIAGSDWFADINLTPTHRVVSGLGTRVVAKDQEQLMQAAWAQVGEVDRANRALALAEFARNLALSLHARLEAVEVGRLFQLTHPLATRVRIDGAALTVAGQTARSATPMAALSGSFRRTVRSTGPLARRLDPAEQDTAASLVTDDRGTMRDFARPYASPDGIGGLSAMAFESLDLEAVSRAFDTSPDEARAMVGRASDVLSGAQTLASAVTTPAVWRDPDTDFRPGANVAERIVSRIQDRVPQDPGRDLVLSRWLGGLSAGLAESQVEGTAALRDVALRLEEAVAVAPVQEVRNGEFDVRSAGAGSVAGGAGMVRSAGELMLRSGAARGVEAFPGVSATAAGARVVSIQRPVSATEREAGVVVSEPERLDDFRTSQGTELATWLEQAQRVTVTDVRGELFALVEATGALALDPTPRRDVLAVQKDDLLRRLDPTRTVIDTMRARLSLGKVSFDAFAGALIRPIMAAPRFDRSMYKALDAYDREWLVPGLGTLPEPELVTLLSMNGEFTEAFLVGLSDEMGRELLWRSYPTDSRGTYFYRFWDPQQDELAHPIHRFGSGPLGSHVSLGPEAESGRAVVVIRGELVRRYPDLTVMALHEQGQDADGHPLLPEAPTGLPDAAPSLFHAMLPPDIMLAGLDITVEALRKPGWWIVISEHPQATRFVRTESDLAGHEARFSSPGGAANGAEVARERLSNPTRVAFEATDFLRSTS